jgi:hypothetical protein
MRTERSSSSSIDWRNTVYINIMLFHDPQSTCDQQLTCGQATLSNQPPRISRTIHCTIGWNTRQLIPCWIPQISQYIATSWRLHIIIIIMSDHIGPVIKKIRDFNIKYYAAWAIEAREALEERGWMKWINPATLTREIKEEDGSEINIIERLCAKALLSQSIGYEHKNRIRD